MIVQHINIQRPYSGEGPYTCTVKIQGEYQEMTLKLDEQRTQEVISVVADLIVDGSRQVAEGLTKQALDHKALEHQTD